MKRDKLEWTWEFPLMSGGKVGRDLLAVLILSVLILALTLLSISGITLDRKLYLIILTKLPALLGIPTIIVLVLALFTVYVVLRDRFTARFCLNADGAMVAATEETRKMNRWITILGFLLGAPGAAGAGLLAQSGENTFIGWQEVYRVTCDDARRIISLRNSWRTVVRLYCGPEIYNEAVSLVYFHQAAAAPARAARIAAGEGRLPRRLLTVAVVWIAAVFVLAYPSLDLRFPAVLLFLLLSGATFAASPWRRRLVGLSFLVWPAFLFLALREGARLSFNLYRPGSFMAGHNLTAVDQSILLCVAAMGAVGLLAAGLWIWTGRIDEVG